MDKTFEYIIIKKLIEDKDYFETVITFVKEGFLDNTSLRLVFKEIFTFYEKYNTQPSYSVLDVLITNVKAGEAEYKSLLQEYYIVKNGTIGIVEPKWLLDSTEIYCRERSVYNAITKSIGILDKKKDDISTIIDVVTEGINVHLDKRVGSDYFEDIDKRFEYYHNNQKQFKTDIDLLDKILRGGFYSKTLSCVLGGTGSGKSLWLCHFATSFMKQGSNVLYITLELSEEEIQKRIDMNLLDITSEDLYKLNREEYRARVIQQQQSLKGRMVVQEFPPSSSNANHFKSLIKDLAKYRNFKPDVLIVDYIGICASTRNNSNANTYERQKNVAEEMRGLAVELDVPILTGVQFNRDGVENDKAGIKNISDSMGVAFTADFMFGIIADEETKKMGTMRVKQIKNRFNDVNYYAEFFVGVDKSKMKLYNVENTRKETAVSTHIAQTVDQLEALQQLENKDLSFDTSAFT